MLVIIPFKADEPKSRLGKVMTKTERRKFAYMMLEDVIDQVERASLDWRVLATSSVPLDNVIIDKRDLNTAINSLIPDKTPLMVVMSDLPLIKSEHLKKILEKNADVVIAPGRRGGTNILAVRSSKFRVSYYGASFCKHVQKARQLSLSLEIFDSFFTSIDIDGVEELIELLIHGNGKSKAYLKSLGFSLNYDSTIPELYRPKELLP